MIIFVLNRKEKDNIWLIFTGAIVGLITYWTIMRGIIASSKCVEDDFSELTEKLLGGKTRFF